MEEGEQQGWEEQIEINFKHVEFTVNTEPPAGEDLH